MSEERLRIGNCSIRQHGTAQHPRNFKNSLVFREFFYVETAVEVSGLISLDTR